MLNAEKWKGLVSEITFGLNNNRTNHVWVRWLVYHARFNAPYRVKHGPRSKRLVLDGSEWSELLRDKLKITHC